MSTLDRLLKIQNPFTSLPQKQYERRKTHVVENFKDRTDIPTLSFLGQKSKLKVLYALRVLLLKNILREMLYNKINF